MARGKLIVIDGTDGTGKATQTALLVERMRKEGIPVETLSFPQYGKKSAGLVEEYLAGNYGKASEITPKQASVFYAVDRFTAKKQMEGWLEAGKNVILDRYVSANMGHQGAKIADTEERIAFYAWNDELEFGIFGLPRPDLNIILHIPVELTTQLLASEKGSSRDIHEKDPEHLRRAEEVYFEIGQMFTNFELVECTNENQILTREEIHEKIWDIVKPVLGETEKG